MRIGSTCSGYGGLECAALALFPAASVAWHSEINPDASRILEHHWPGVPNHGDLTTIDWATVEPVDILAGGFPCQDVSTAGRRAGLRPGTRTGIWTQIAYGISVLRPRLVLLENVGGLLSAGAHSDMEPCPWCMGDAGSEHVLRALGAVLGDLASLGYDASWVCIRAADVGAPHGRARVFIAATDTRSGGWQGWASQLGSGRGEAVWGEESRDAGDASGALTPADTRGGGVQRRGVGRVVDRETRPGEGDRSQRERDGHAAVDCGAVATLANSSSRGFDQPGAGRSSLQGSEQHERPAQQPGRLHRSSASAGAMDWGTYGPAIARWERVLGRRAPRPTEPGRTGRERLSPRFVEWMQGLPDGWVTDPAIGISRNAQLTALGNGVVPQQAEAAYRILLERLCAAEAA